MNVADYRADFTSRSGASRRLSSVRLAGDRESEVRYLAEQVGIRDVYAGRTPEEKVALSVVGMFIAFGGWLPPVGGAIFQEIIDLAAVLNALRAAVPGGELSNY
jgi:cation transport ATPase